jgi:hypothetical protein
MHDYLVRWVVGANQTAVKGLNMNNILSLDEVPRAAEVAKVHSQLFVFRPMLVSAFRHYGQSRTERFRIVNGHA